MERRKPRVNFNIGEGKLPPQEIDLEEAVLGALMIEKGHVDDILEILTEKCFYKDNHGIIFKAIVDLHSDKEPTDILTVTATLKKRGQLEQIGGAYYITQLTNRVASSANIIPHAGMIAEAFLAREVIRIGGEFSERAFNNDEDVFELMQEYHSEVDSIKNYGGFDEKDIPLAVSLKETLDKKKRDVASNVKLTGIRTGNNLLDNLTSGFNKGQLIIVAATSGEGKSARGLKFGRVAADDGHRVPFFSLEMSSKQIQDRMLIEESMVNSNDYRVNKLSLYDIEKLDIAERVLSKLPINLVCKAGVSCKYIARKCKDIIKKYGKIGMIVVDYIQIMGVDEKQSSREVAVASISRGLKQIAMELDVPVIALSQLNKDYSPTKKDARRPTMSNLRESQAIGNDADLVLFVYRPAYHFSYGEHPDDKYSPDNISEQEYLYASELIVGKNREGEIGIINEFYIGKHVKFQNEPPSFIQSIIQEISNNDIQPSFSDNPLPF